jgi:hypothetical protein
MRPFLKMRRMIFRGFLLLFIVSIASFPQSLAELLEKAPPDVDEALRATVSKFYQAHVDGKFRVADEVVAEDSKDAFFAAEKRRCRSFEIVTLKYSDNFTRARAVVACDTEMMIPMGGRVAVKMPQTTLWKYIDGSWWWYVEPPDPKGQQAPFGTMRPGPEGGSSPPASFPANPVDLQTVSRLVKVDKQEVRLDADSATPGRVVVTNHMPGAVSLSLEYLRTVGLEATLERTSLNAGESTTLSVRRAPSAERPPGEATIQIVVAPTEQVIPIRVHISDPPSEPPGK